MKSRPFPLPFSFARRAFTLVEVLVATAVLLILVVLLANVLTSTTRISAQATSGLNAARLGREVFGLIEKDLSQVVTTRSSQSTNVPLQFWVNPPQLDSAYRNATALFWQSAISRDRSSGGVAIVGYFVQRTTDRAQLRRVLIEPTDPLYQIGANSTNWLSATTIEQFAATNGSSASSQLDRGWVADGVLGLWVRCLDANGSVISTNGAGASQGYRFDSRLGFQSGSGTNQIVHKTFNALPAFLDVGLMCIAPNDVARITELTATLANSPTNFESEMAASLAEFSAKNPRVKSATLLTRRFRLYGAY